MFYINHGGYCHLCENNNISECNLCGAEIYNSNLTDGICNKCASGQNKPCTKCGENFNKNKLSSDSLEDEIKRLKKRKKVYGY